MSLPPFLLTMPTYTGTLAAVRSVGASGIPATIAGHEVLAAARWSKFATRWVRSPPVNDSGRWVEWLLSFGEREPRHVLYGSSDDVAFLTAAHESELADRFYLYQPPLKTMVRVLDKRALHEACASAGLDTLPTWFPQSEADLAPITREAQFPLILKARTQVRRALQTKGVVAHCAADLTRAYHAFLSSHRYFPGLEAHFGDVSQPMIQSFSAEGALAVYSVTGFVDRSGERHAMRAAVKVMQRTRPVGLGLCFEAAPLEPRLADAALRLCRAVGHFGAFEIEFVRDGDRAAVIDFNPRFYGQMGFDAARRLPLALMVYHAARGDDASLDACIAAAANAPADGATAYTHRFVFELLLLAARLRGSENGGDDGRWRRWYAENRTTVADAAADREDWAPGIVHAAAELGPGVRRLRKLLFGRGNP